MTDANLQLKFQYKPAKRSIVFYVEPKYQRKRFGELFMSEEIQPPLQPPLQPPYTTFAVNEPIFTLKLTTIISFC